MSGNLTLDLDKEVVFGDNFWFNMSQHDDIELDTGLAEIENDKTVDTTKPDEVKAFVEGVRAMEVGQGDVLWDLVARLPNVNDKKGLNQTRTRIVKYLLQKKLMTPSYDSKCSYI